MLAFILMIVAVILFLLASWPKVSTSVNLMALGLAAMAASLVFGLYPG